MGTSSTVNVNVLPAPATTITIMEVQLFVRVPSVTLTSSNGIIIFGATVLYPNSITATTAGNYIVTVT